MDFSYSRLTCYRMCPRKFDLHYTKKIEDEDPMQMDTFRGLFLHEYAETYLFESIFESDNLDEMIKSFETENRIKFSDEDRILIRIGVRRIKKIFSEYIFPLREKGFQVSTEGEYLFDFHGHKLTTKLDVLLLKRGEAIIIDWKSGRSMNTDYYKEQLAFYKMVIASLYTIPDTSVKTKICFLLADTEDTLIENFLINVPITYLEIKEFQHKALETLKEIETNPKTEPTMSRMCKYCQFRSGCYLYAITGGRM